jgi:EmrB/QacA subfamily drug resistance transporter
MTPPPRDPVSTDALRPTTVSRREFLNLFLAVFVPMFMGAVDQTLLATATPAIAASLGGLRDTSWIAVAYLLASATIVPVYGRLGDARGRRTLLFVALALFATGSIACALAQSFPQIVAARVLQGIGGGGLMTLSQAMIGELVPPLERVRFQGYFALVFTTASIGGPVIGGIVVTHFDWRWLFLANLPLCAFAAWRLCSLPRGERHPRSGSMDIPGHVLFALGAITALYWLTSAGHRFPWLSSTSAALFGTAVAAIAALFRHERRHPSPFLPMDLLRDVTIRRSALLVMLFAACLFSMVFFLPIYLQLGHHVTAQLSGLLLLPMTAGQVTAAMISARIIRRTGEPHYIPVTGMSLASAALFLLGVLPSNMAVVIVLGFLTGIGFGTVMSVNQVVVQTAAGRTRLGSATAMVSLARSTGAACGAALFGALVFSMIGDMDRQSLLAHATELDTARVTAAFHWGFLCASLLAALAAYTASRVPRLSLGKPRVAQGSTR